MIKVSNYSLSVLVSLLFLSEQAFAEGISASPAAGISQFLVLGGFLLIFYLLIWRPQSKRAKTQRDLLQAIQVNDEVVTAGGLLGKVLKIEDGFVILQLTENNQVIVQKQAITASLLKGTMDKIR